ncbi:MAG TPA: CpsD/CapB family tyrosine-protein kinase [Bryobacteraceae bacterium]|jgi:receptor protein-tyrosine kinase|nr:CpsD/CapB family tyrosine-protein kinase [Bryobacteraceae bacterium]
MSRIFEAFQNYQEDLKSANGSMLDPKAPSVGTEDEHPLHPILSHACYKRVAIQVPKGAPLVFLDQSAVVSEQYRLLRTNITQLPTRPRSIAVSSAVAGDGKTITATNLAGFFAIKKDVRVLLIDADLRQRALTQNTGCRDAAGLSDLLRGAATLAEAVIQVDQVPNLYVLPAGKARGNPAELLDSKRWSDLIRDLKSEFDYVFLDTTPITAVADCRIVQEVADGTLLVVRPEHTSRAALVKILQEDVQHKLLGIVVNGCKDWFLWKSLESYGYYAAPDHELEKKPSRWTSLFKRKDDR